MSATSSARHALVAAALFLAACGGAAQPPTTSLRVKGNVLDASVTIDDQYIGTFAYVASKGVALPPGKHRVTIEKTGYFPWDQIVEGKEGAPPVHLDVKLTKIPD